MSFAKGAALSDQVHDPNHTFVRSLIDLKGTVEAPEIWEVVDKSNAVFHWQIFATNP